MENSFIHFSEIALNAKHTWQGKKILSFDLDWVSDPVLDWFLNFINTYKIKVTVFITNPTHLIDKIRRSDFIEIGIHPFFKDIKADNYGVKETINFLKGIVPEAKVIRSHRLTTSASWNEIYKQSGFDFSSNYVMFGNPNISPWPHLNGVVEVPIYFSDDGFFRIKDDTTSQFDLSTISFKSDENAIQVYDFHPIHCFLNTESVTRYDLARPFFNDYDQLKNHVNKGFGTLDLLISVINGERVISDKTSNQATRP